MINKKGLEGGRPLTGGDLVGNTSDVVFRTRLSPSRRGGQTPPIGSDGWTEIE